jgi:alkylation response protein AidB-like acyl-CoA dehydrogenase
MTATASPTLSSDRDLTDEQRAFVEALRDFCARECTQDKVRALVGDNQQHDGHSPQMARQLAELGYWGLTIEETYGGPGGTFLDSILFLEQVAYGRAPIGAWAVTQIVCGALNRFATEEQKREHLGRVAQGDALAIAMSEPDSGSDVASLKCRARRDNGSWVLDGTKMWCSYAHVADRILVVCRSEQGSQRHEGLSMILVPRDAEGLTITPISTLGGEETNELALDGVRVGADALIGTEGNGWRQLMAGLNYERTILGASSLGLAQRAFDDALAYAKERVQGGRPIGTYQVNQHKFSDMATALVQARLLVRWVARLTDEEPERMLAQEASMVKVSCTELAKRCALEGVQLMGGYGYATEYPMEHYLRSAVVHTIFGGTSEIQKNIIARTLGL